ncbi:MAG: hypothetical protein ABR596_07125 [Halarsenatibacteraceae bacterium]
MKRLAVISLSVLLIVGLMAGSSLAFRGHGSRGQRGYFGEDLEAVESYEDLTEEEIAELEEVQRQLLRLSERISVLGEEYRQSIIDGASDEELAELEDQLFELRDEMAELREDNFSRFDQSRFNQINPRNETGFTGMMRDFAGTARRSGVHCW